MVIRHISLSAVWAYPIRGKDWVFSIFSNWLAMVENQSDRKLQCLQTDNGGSSSMKNSTNFAKNPAFDVNIRHPIVLSIMGLPNV